MMFGEEGNKQNATGNSNVLASEKSNANSNTNNNNPTVTNNIIIHDPSTRTSLAEAEHAVSLDIRQPIRYIPHSRNHYFTGRESILKSLHASFWTNNANNVALYGMGGVGKTQIAIQYVYSYYNDYHTILWARADLNETLTSDFVAFAKLLGLPEKDAQEQNLTTNAVKRWLEMNTGWLLILDNADNLATVRNFIPLHHAGHILLTTRTPFVSRIAQSIEIKQMSSEEGANFLLRRINFSSVEASHDTMQDNMEEYARNISRIMDGLPLALEQAGAYIAEMGCGLKHYLNLYNRRRTALLGWRSELDEDQKTVTTTWSLNFEQVQRNNPAAAELLELFSFLHPDAIPEEIVSIAAPFLSTNIQSIAGDPYDTNQVIGELRKYSLIRRTPDSPAISIHRLVQTVIKDGMDENTQFSWAERIVKTINHALPDLKFETWPQYQRYLPHAQACAELIQQHDITSPEATRVLNVVGQYLCERANYKDAEILLHKALEIREKQSVNNDLNVADTLKNIAELYRQQGKYSQALHFCTRALTIQEQELGTDNANVASSINSLARLHQHLGQYPEAEELYQRALTIRRLILGSEHSDIAESLNDLASIYSLLSQDVDAESLCQQALSIRKQALGENHPEVALSLNNLAMSYNEQGKYSQAEDLHQQALSIYKQALGENHPDVAGSLSYLADCYKVQGKYSQAEDLYLQALSIYKQALGENHPDVATSLNNLAVCYDDQGKYSQAEDLHQQALSIRKQALGENHLDVAMSLSNLATCYRVQDKYSQAEDLYQQALSIRKQALGENHPDVARSLNRLASCYREQGRYSTAIILFKQVIDMSVGIFGEEHSIIADSLEGHAILLLRQGKNMSSKLLFERALSIREKISGNYHPSLGHSLRYLALISQRQGHHFKAKSYYERIFVIYRQTLVNDHPKIKQVIKELSSTQSKIKQQKNKHKRS